MKHLFPILAASLFLFPSSVVRADICNCAVCPERENDFCWENDRVGFRAYGPGEYHKWSGIDVFNKNTSDNVCLKWLHRVIPGNFHANRGQGMDNYTMGASRGVGGVAMYADGEWKTFPDWESSRVLHTGDDYLEFELVYPAFSAAGKMTYHITMRRGERFFRNDVSFERMPAGFLCGPGLDLEPTRDHKGSLAEDPGMVSLFEEPKGAKGAEGSTMSAVFVAPGAEIVTRTDHLNCRVLAFRGKKSFTYWAGASWSLAGEITTPAAWHEAVRAFRARLAAGVTGKDYLDLMEAAVGAYPDERLASYLAEAERDGVQEHGFPRLAANLGVLVANGRCANRRDLLKRMMDVACRDAAKGVMPPKSGGNEFSVKELIEALSALERAKTFPKSVTDAWRKQIKSIVAENCYTTGRREVGLPTAGNWVVFAAASEQMRLSHKLGGDPAFVEKYVADQIRWFDANGMYRDPNQPAVYDFVTRLQFAVILSEGYEGPSRARLEELMETSAEPTLKMLSATGEIPYGGRSNQFLHNNTFYAALCEWYAARDAEKGNWARAVRFRAAAARAVAALKFWLDEKPVSHVKNRYPRESGKGVYSELGDMGCERYAYFDKYMVTMGSWALLGWRFANGTLPVGREPESAAAEVFETTDDFHWLFLTAGDYSAQFDYRANGHYDCSGLGRIQRRGAPSALCLSVPCAAKPSYRIEGANDAPLAIVPVGWPADATSAPRLERKGSAAVCEWTQGDAVWKTALSPEGLAMTLTGEGAVALTLPAFAFDGREETKIVATEKTLTVSYRGWSCIYVSNGELVDTGRSACNRNGRYRRFEVRGQNRLSVEVSIVRQ